MNCRDVTQLLVPYLDNEVAPSERRLIQAHLAGCASLSTGTRRPGRDAQPAGPHP